MITYTEKYYHYVITIILTRKLKIEIDGVYKKKIIRCSLFLQI